MKKSLTFWDIFPVSLIIVGSLLLTGQILIRRRLKEGEPVEIEDETTDTDDEPEITRETRIINNYQVIRKSLPETISDDTAKIITAMAMHESGVFTSRLYKEQNNLFGMRHPVVRDTLSTEDRGGFANFATLEDSVHDLLLYFKEFNLKPNWKEPSEFVKAIKSKGYFEDPYLVYFNAVRSHLSKVKALVQ